MKILFSLVLIFSSVIIASAQERVIDKSEFDALLAGGYSHQLKWKGEKYRMTVTTSSTVAGRPQTDWSSKTISEYGTSAETRRIFTSVFGGNAALPKESVRIGDWLYTRSGNDAWTRKEFVPSNTPAREQEESPRKVLSSQTEYKYLGQSTLVDRPVHVYVRAERRTIFNEKSGENAETESKTTYWFDGKGLILKSEHKSEYRGKNTMQTGVAMEWELDPSITFTVPETTP